MNAQNRCCYEFGSFRLDPAEHILFHDGEVVSLTPKAFDTLLVLIENHGHLVEKDELLEKVWADSFVEEANVAKHISMLRKVLSGNGLKEPFIETIPKRGYRFVAPLKKTEVGASKEVTIEVKTPEAVEQFDRSSLPGTSTGRKGITAPLLLVGIIAAVLAVGGWYYLPSLIEDDRLAIETTQVSLSTGFEKARAGVISPDGKLVAFRRLRQGKQESLAVRRLADGETIDLLSDLDKGSAIWATFSPDSKSIYYNRYRKDNAGVYRVPVTGGQGEKLIAGMYSPVAFSRDGNQITFGEFKQGQEGGTVFVADKNGKNQKAIAKVKRRNYITQSVFSNDGQRVLVWEGEAGKHSGKWVNIDDKTETEAKELAPLFEQNWGHIRLFVLLKDGSGYLFQGAQTRGNQIFHLSTVSGKITQITNASRLGRFSVSDDGKTIAATTGGGGAFNMISYDPVTKESRKIMNDNSTFVPWWGGFSQMPDGKILFSNGNGKGSDIYSMNKNGGNENRLTSDDGADVNPVATPDGKYIVFKSSRSGAFNLWRMDADGRNPVRLTNYLQNELGGIDAFDLWNRSIQIANNGKTVFFAQQPNPGGKSKLMKISINGGEPAELLPNSRTSNIRPYISPDGKKLAYVGFVFDSKTSQNKFTTYIHSLKEDKVGELKKTFEQSRRRQIIPVRPQWTPDGKALTHLDQNRNMWKRDIETGKETALTSFKSEADKVMMFNWSNDGKKIFIVRGVWGQPEVVLIKNRDISRKLY